MPFFNPKEPFTHYGSFYCVPCYFDMSDPDDIEVAGTNKFFDFLVEYICPYLHFVVDFCHELVFKEPMPGFPLRIHGELVREVE